MGRNRSHPTKINSKYKLLIKQNYSGLCSEKELLFNFLLKISCASKLVIPVIPVIPVNYDLNNSKFYNNFF